MSTNLERRILILAPTSRDAVLTCTILHETGVKSAVCEDWYMVTPELHRGAGAVLLAEEFVSAGQSRPIADTTAKQPPWSDLPIMLITAQGADSPAVSLALESL